MKLRYLLWPLAILLTALITTLGLVVSTQTGLLAAIDVAKRVLPGELRIERIEGCLLGPLVVEDLHYADGDFKIGLEKLRFNWYPRDLLRLHVNLETLTSQGLEIHLPPPGEPEETEPLQLSAIPLPLGFEITNATLTDTRIWLHQADKPLVIDSATLRAHSEGRRIIVETLAASAPEGEVALDGELELAGANPLEVHLRGTFNTPDAQPLRLLGSVTGELNQTLAVDIKASELVDATLVGEITQPLQELGWSVELDLAALALGQFSPELGDSSITGELTSAGNLDGFQVDGGFATTLPEVGAITAKLNLTGSPRSLKLRELALQSAEQALALTARADIDLAQQILSADGQWRDLAWPLTGEPQVISPRGQFTAKGTPKQYQLQLTADLDSTQSGPIAATLAAVGTDQRVTLSQLELRATQGDLALNVQGELRFADLTFSANGQWQALTWPLVGTPQVESPAGTFEARGNIKDYGFSLDTRVQGPVVPRGDWSLTGRGSAEAMRKLTLTGKTLEGEIRAELSATWAPAISWQVQVSGQALNPGAKWPELPGKLTLGLRSEGSVAEAGGIQATVNLDELSGTLTGQNVRGSGSVEIQDETFRVQDFSIDAGNARLVVQGTLAEAWDLSWQLQASDLSRLLPTATGSITGSGQVTGPRDKPRAVLDATMDALGFGDMGIQRLRASANIDISGATRSRLDINGSGLELAGQSWQTLTVTGSGTPADQQLRAALNGPLGSLELALSGSYDQREPTWRGRLTRLSADNPRIGAWNLSKPLGLQLSAQRIRAEPSCLVSAPTRLCFQGRWDASAGGEGRIRLEKLELERFNPLLPETVRVRRASLGGEANARIGPDGNIQGNAVIRLSRGRIMMTADGGPARIGLADGELLRVRIEGNSADGRLNLNLRQLGRIAANMTVTNLSGQPGLQGKIKADIQNLSLLSTFVPQVEDVSGRIVANLDVSGTPVAVLIGGGVQLQNGTANIPQFDTRIRNVRFAANSDGRGTLNISGSADSGDGQIQLSGSITPADRRLSLEVKGEDFQVANSPDLQALINPDIQVSMRPDVIRVEGEVVIPEANIRPMGGSSSTSGTRTRVGVSPDVVVVKPGEDPTALERAPGLGIYTRVRIILGDNIRVEAFDFAGKVSGDILLTETPRIPLRASGSAEVAAGEFTISGQRLKIERGRVLFNNSPVDNPSLDLRVTRTVEEAAPVQSSRTWNQTGFNELQAAATATGGRYVVVAGAQVTGTARNPKLNLFSNPPMPDSSILSYLVLGRAPTSSGGGSVVLGKYLTPNLWVGYGVGISAETENTFILRYDILKNWAIRANSSAVSSGADLLYTIRLR